jgi:hypothetical protein
MAVSLERLAYLLSLIYATFIFELSAQAASGRHSGISFPVVILSCFERDTTEDVPDFGESLIPRKRLQP